VRLSSGLPDEEVFTSSIGALWGGGRARWGDEILTATAGRWRGGGDSFSDGVPATGSSSGGEGGGGDVVEHQETNRELRCGPKEKDEGDATVATTVRSPGMEER
jgi:hypothetical protein